MDVPEIGVQVGEMLYLVVGILLSIAVCVGVVNWVIGALLIGGSRLAEVKLSEHDAAVKRAARAQARAAGDLEYFTRRVENEHYLDGIRADVDRLESGEETAEHTVDFAVNTLDLDDEENEAVINNHFGRSGGDSWDREPDEFDDEERLPF